MTAFASDDLRAMRRALALAEKGRGTTRPNPIVGAVITKGGRVLATGYHERAGGPHAEVAALNALGGRAPGATLYVTLEPCCHTGRTGPCTEAILAAGIKRVVVGCQDEYPLVAGRGIRRLRRAGVAVEVGCLEDECRRQNRGFFRWARDGRPHVTLKVATSLDGFIAPAAARRPGDVHWLTGPPALTTAHLLRAQHDAILVGAGTVHADDPRLTVRLPEKEHARARTTDPLRVIVDGRLSVSARARIFHQRGVRPPLVFAATAAAAEPAFARRRRAIEATGAEVMLVPAGRGGMIPPARILGALAKREVQLSLLEGGAGLHGAFVNAGLVDEVALFLAPELLGGGVPVCRGPGLASPLRLGPLRAIQIANDILVSADVARDASPPRR